MSNAEETLDPDDWALTREIAHQMVDDAVKHISDVRDRPVWKEMPERARAHFTTPAPAGPTPLDAVYDELRENLLPYSMGNIHPRFWGVVHGVEQFHRRHGRFSCGNRRL